MSISESDRFFLEKVVDDSISADYIYPPYNWRGYGIRALPLEHTSACWVCCIPCMGRGNDELAVLLGTVFFIFSSIIAFGYTLRSAQSACAAQHDLMRAQGRVRSSPSELRELYSDAIILLEGRLRERGWVALSQGVVTVGAALLTAVLLVAFIAEGELFMLDWSLVGIGLIAAGGISYATVRWLHIKEAPQQAADRISKKLYPY